MSKESKILDLEALAAKLQAARGRNLRIVQCHGVFDLLHVGHIRHFEQARQLGDLLVVTLTPDRFVNKGTGRPAFPESLRAEVVASLHCVDYVAINQWPSACETIRLLQPHIYAKGDEFKDLKDTINHVSLEEEAVRMIGGQIAFTRDITFSSSALINQYLSAYPDEVKEFLADFSTRFAAEQILSYLKRAAQLKVLVVGETIIDEYQFCEVMGKSGKEPVLATRYGHTDRFGGGVIACANHLASFCDTVDVATFLGEGSDHEAFLRAALKPNVRPTFFCKAKSPTIVKARFVEQYLGQKLFEVYHMNDTPLTAQENEQFCGHLRRAVPNYDIIIVADYGHGIITREVIDILCTQSRFLAVNTQSNAGNNGMNTISRYPRADYVCLAAREFALETRDRNLPPEEQVLAVARKLSCRTLMSTLGRRGTLSYSEPNGFTRVPAFATQIVDRVGAGDAVLCLTSLCVAQGAHPEIVGFVGNVVGAEAVAIMGNQRSIERVPLCRHIECLLKLHHASQRDAASRIRIAA